MLAYQYGLVVEDEAEAEDPKELEDEPDEPESPEEAEVGCGAAELDEPEDGPALEPEPVPSPALFEPVGDGPDVCVVELGPAVGTPVPVDVCVADPSPASVDVAVLVLDDAVPVVVLLWSPLEPSLELVGAAPFAVVVVVAELESSEDPWEEPALEPELPLGDPV